MPATFLDLHKAEKKITKALEPLDDDSRKAVLLAILKRYE